MLSKYDAENPKALRELVAAGTKLMPFPQPVMEAAFNASNELYAEISAKNAEVQEDLRQLAAVPQRGDPVVPRLPSSPSTTSPIGPPARSVM